MNFATCSRPRRRGVSVFQLLSCLLAVGAGLWVGAQYSGVQLNDVAYTALEQTQMLEKMPEEWRPVLSECPTGDCEPQVSAEQQAAELEDELTNLRLEVATLRQAALSGEAFYNSGSQVENQMRRDQTLAYWLRLCEIVTEVNELDESVQPVLSENTTGHVFDLRRRSFDYGQRAIEAIDLSHVDPKAIEAGHRLGEWYREGIAFYTKATDVWDSLAGKQRVSTAEQSLEKTRAHNEKQTELLRAKLAELGRLLSRRYAVALPTIGV